MAETVYFAHKPPEEMAEDALSKVDRVINFCRSARIWERYRVNYNLYYGMGPGAVWSDNLRPGGDDGESVDLCINIGRQLLQRQFAMISSVRPPIIPKALSTDEQAARKVQIGRGLIEKALRKLGGYRCMDEATEQGQAIGAGFIHGTWNHFGGDLHAVADPADVPPGIRPRIDHVMGDDGQPLPKMDEQGQPALDEMGQPVMQTQANIFKGEIKFESLTVKDVYTDPTSTSWDDDIDWMMVRTWRNRWDLAVMYPEQFDKIVESKSRSAVQFNEWDSQLPLPTRGAFDLQYEDDKVLVWYFYHRRSAAVPEGLMSLFLDDGTILEHEDLPFKKIPLWRVAPSKVIGTSLPYGNMNSLGGIQEAFNNLWSAIITNVMAFSRQVLWTYKGSGVEYNSVGGGLRLLELDPSPTGGDPVKPLDLLLIKEELFKVSELLQSFGQSDTGVNAIAQGDPRGVTAGIAINLFEAMAQQSGTPLESSRTEALEGMAMWVLEAYRQHPDIERDVHIVGVEREHALEKFYGRDLDGLEEIDTEATNPMDRTVAGRLQKLQALREFGAPITIEQAMQVLDTGNFESATDGVADENALIKAENEALAKGQPVAARMGDNHMLHMAAHRKVGANPELRLQDAQMRMQFGMQMEQAAAMGAPPPQQPLFPLGPLNDHEMQHLQLWTQGDAVLNMVQGRLPPGPPWMMPPPMAQPGQPGAPGAQQGAHPEPGRGPPPAAAQDPRAAFKPPAPVGVPPVGAQRAPTVQ